jgi:hypothetical protein
MVPFHDRALPVIVRSFRAEARQDDMALFPISAFIRF